MNQLPICRTVILSLAASALAASVGAQSTGGMSPSSTGSAAAGGSPTGMVLPSTVQTGSTAPTLPGHAITSERRVGGYTTRTGSGPTTGPVAQLPAQTESAVVAYQALDSTHRGYLSRSDVQGLQGFSFDEADANKDGRLSEEEFAKAWNTKPSR